MMRSIEKYRSAVGVHLAVGDTDNQNMQRASENVLLSHRMRSIARRIEQSETPVQASELRREFGALYTSYIGRLIKSGYVVRVGRGEYLASSSNRTESTPT